MNRIIYFSLLSLLLSCNNNKVVKTSQKEIKNHIPKKQLNKKLGDYMSDEKYFVWTAKHSDTSGFLCEVVFKKQYVDYVYHGQCIYSYFTNYYHTNTDKIELLWSYKSDCIGGVDFIEKSNGIKKHPKRGDSFCEYTLINDSIIKAKYNFPEWTNKVNQIAKDSIFPIYLYLKKEGDI
jgi:hypothetical protein